MIIILKKHTELALLTSSETSRKATASPRASSAPLTTDPLKVQINLPPELSQPISGPSYTLDAQTIPP